MSGSDEQLFSYVVPLYNEGDNVDALVSGILGTRPPSVTALQLILVENGSADHTAERLAALEQAHPEVEVVTLERNAGYGGGILAGMRAARGDVIGYGWGDGQIPPETVWLCLEAVEQGAPWAKALRGARAEGVSRRVQSHAYMLLMKAAFGVPWGDVNGCPKVFRKETWERLEPTASDWFLDPEISLRALREGLPPVEVASPHLPRQQGRSKVHLGTAVSFVVELARWKAGLRR